MIRGRNFSQKWRRSVRLEQEEQLQMEQGTMGVGMGPTGNCFAVSRPAILPCDHKRLLQTTKWANGDHLQNGSLFFFFFAEKIWDFTLCVPGLVKSTFNFLGARCWDVALQSERTKSRQAGTAGCTSPSSLSFLLCTPTAKEKHQAASLRQKLQSRLCLSIVLMAHRIVPIQLFLPSTHFLSLFLHCRDGEGVPPF